MKIFNCPIQGKKLTIGSGNHLTTCTGGISGFLSIILFQLKHIRVFALNNGIAHSQRGPEVKLVLKKTDSLGESQVRL